MKKLLLSSAMLFAVVTAGALTSAAPAQAGCVSGAIIGGVAGHVLGHHGLAGAAAGCAIGSIHRRHRYDRRGYDDRDYGYRRPYGY